jgi:hypothetical protein
MHSIFKIFGKDAQESVYTFAKSPFHKEQETAFLEMTGWCSFRWARACGKFLTTELWDNVINPSAIPKK